MVERKLFFCGSFL